MRKWSYARFCSLVPNRLQTGTRLRPWGWHKILIESSVKRYLLSRKNCSRIFWIGVGPAAILKMYVHTGCIILDPALIVIYKNSGWPFISHLAFWYLLQKFKPKLRYLLKVKLFNPLTHVGFLVNTNDNQLTFYKI